MINIKYDIIKDHIGSISFNEGMSYEEAEEFLGKGFNKKLIYHAYIVGIHMIIYSKKSVILYKEAGSGIYDFYSRKKKIIIMRGI